MSSFIVISTRSTIGPCSCPKLRSLQLDIIGSSAPLSWETSTLGRVGEGCRYFCRLHVPTLTYTGSLVSLLHTS